MPCRKSKICQRSKKLETFTNKEVEFFSHSNGPLAFHGQPGTFFPVICRQDFIIWYSFFLAKDKQSNACNKKRKADNKNKCCALKNII
jgi:hypothetical protein